jgi:hypothetical protein
MPNKGALKGKKFESDLVKIFTSQGHDAIRAWGSNGLALGETKETDLLVNGYRIQAKKGYNQPTKRFHDFLQGTDIVIWECADRRKTPYGPFCFMNIETLLRLLKDETKD